MPLSIQRIQTDRGREFFAYRVQERLREWSIKFRPIPGRVRPISIEKSNGCSEPLSKSSGLRSIRSSKKGSPQSSPYIH